MFAHIIAKVPGAFAFSLRVVHDACPVCLVRVDMTTVGVQGGCLICWVCRRVSHIGCCRGVLTEGTPPADLVWRAPHVPWTCGACNSQLDRLVQDVYRANPYDSLGHPLHSSDVDHAGLTLSVPRQGGGDCHIPCVIRGATVSTPDLMVAQIGEDFIMDRGRRDAVMRVLPPTARGASNSVTPVSAFPNAAIHFDNLFAAAGECPPFIDSVPPILTEMLQAVRFAFCPFFCSCAATGDAPACFFHLGFLGRVSHSYILDVPRLEHDLRTHFVVSKSVAGALSRLGVRSACVWHAGLRCFFVALSVALFGSPCWGLLLKKRFLWWACANVVNDHIMAPLDVSAGDSGRSVLDARLIQLFEMARGELSDGGTPLAVLWGLLDLQININVLFDHVAFRGGPAVGISGLSLLRDGRLDLGRDVSGPRHPRVLTDVLLRNIGDHFEPITWASLDVQGMSVRFPLNKARSPRLPPRSVYGVPF